MSATLPDILALDKNQEEAFKQKIQTYQNKEGYSDDRGVILAKHLPLGLHEPQIKKYFEQFGEVTRLRLSRSKKTGASKNFAFIEFASNAVAKIVADTMKDYVMFRKRFSCKFIPANELNPNTFRGCDRTFRKPKAHILSIKRHNRSIINRNIISKGNKQVIKSEVKSKTLNKKQNAKNVKGVSSSTKSGKILAVEKISNSAKRNNKLKRRLKKRMIKIVASVGEGYKIKCQQSNKRLKK